MTPARSAPEIDDLKAGPQPHRLSLEAHRVAEYAIGLALVSLPFGLGAPVASAGLGGAVVVGIGATTRGRLCVVQWCSPRLHRGLDLAAVVLLAVIPLAPWTGGGLVAIYLEPSAAVLARAGGEPEPQWRCTR
jgi:hypothetical protein